MSGRREATITISEAEYRRLRDPDMKQRFSPDKKIEINASQVDEQIVYALLGDEHPNNGQLLNSLARTAPHPTIARLKAEDCRRAVSMLRPQLIGQAEYQNRRREYARQLLAVFRKDQRPEQRKTVQVDPALCSRLRVAAQLQHAVQRAGYHYAGIDMDNTRTTALVHLVRDSDGSRVTLVVSKDDSLFDAAQPPASRTQESPTSENAALMFQRSAA